MMEQWQEFTSLWNSLTFTRYDPRLTQITGDVTAAIILSDLIYWNTPTATKDHRQGGLYRDGLWYVVRSYDDFQSLLGLDSVYSIRRAIKVLEDRGLVIVKRLKSPFHKTSKSRKTVNAFHLVRAQLISSFAQYGEIPNMGKTTHQANVGKTTHQANVGKTAHQANVGKTAHSEVHSPVQRHSTETHTETHSVDETPLNREDLERWRVSLATVTGTQSEKRLDSVASQLSQMGYTPEQVQSLELRLRAIKFHWKEPGERDPLTAPQLLELAKSNPVRISKSGLSSGEDSYYESDEIDYEQLKKELPNVIEN